MKQLVYLDYNATAPIRPQVREVMMDVIQHPYNPSSIHQIGRAAKALVEKSRKTIAMAISCFPQELVFTASGTEANNMVLQGFKEQPLACSATEHASVLKVRPDAFLLPVDGQGLLEMDALEQWLQQQTSLALVSVMLANNETGVIQPIKEIASLVHHYGGLLHCDAVQALGKITLDTTLLGADMLSFSAHKIGGGQGTGALFIQQKIELPKLVTGGGQELGRRAGTEHVAGIAGFSKAVELAYEDTGWRVSVRGWLEVLEERAITAAKDDTIVLGRQASRLSNTTSLRMPGIKSETQLMQFDLAGFAISAGSACSSGRIEPSHVVKAMLKDKAGDDVIRISAGWNTKEEHILSFTEKWLQLMTKNQGNNP